jgi:hypothetical protein
VINVPVVRDNLLDNRRSDFWLRSWRRGWRRRRWRRRGGRGALFFASDDDLVSYDFAVVLGRRLGAWAADDKLLALPSNQLAASAYWRRKTPLAASDCQGSAFSAGVSAVAAEFAAVCTELKVTVLFLEADRASLSRHVAAMATDLAARGAEVYVVASAAASEANLLVVHLTWGRSADGSHGRAITAAEDNVIALRGAARLLAAADCDVVALNLSHRRGGGRWAASSRAYVIVKTTTAAGSGAGKVVVVTPSHHQGAGGWAVVVLAQEVWHAAARVRGDTGAAQLEVEVFVVALAAVAIAVEVALTLFIELSGGVASRHCAGEQAASDRRGRVWARG